MKQILISILLLNSSVTVVFAFDCKQAAASKVEQLELEALYKDLHAKPELSFYEKETSKRVAQELRNIGMQVTESVGGYGVVALFENGPGPTVMLRMDMDALPIKEETGASYASKYKQSENGEEKFVMHACGHDVHMTNIIGSARALIRLKSHWNGTLLVIAQPAEERGAGALAMLKEGLFQRFPRPDYAIAHHVKAELEVGKLALVEGYHTANVDSVDILVKGIGGHGARPHQTKDPIVIASQIVVALQTIVSREVDPLDPAVVTVGSFHAGTKHNIIPNQAKLQLTVRSYADEVRDKVLEAIKRVAIGVGKAAGLDKDLLPEVTLTKKEYTPAGYNDPLLSKRAKRLWVAQFGKDKVVDGKPSMGGEDFARYGQVKPKIPTLLFRLGVLAPSKVDRATIAPLHSSKFLPEYKGAITTGVAAVTALTLDLFGVCSG